jgi:hypothetical protein
MMIELLMLVLFIVNVGMAYFLYQQDVEIEKIKKELENDKNISE